LRSATEVTTVDNAAQLFVEDLNHQNPGLLVFLRFFTQNVEQPIRFLGCQSVSENATPAQFFSLIEAETNVSSDNLLIFDEIVRKQDDTIHPLNADTLLFSIRKSQLHFLTFQELPRVELVFPEDPNVHDCSEFCPSYREGLYPVFMDWKFKFVRSVIADRANPTEPLTTIRLRSSCSHVREIIAKAVGIPYDPKSEGLLLSPDKSMFTPVALDSIPSTIFFRKITSYNEYEVGNLSKMTINIHQDMYKWPPRVVRWWLRESTTMNDFVVSLKQDGEIPAEAPCRVFLTEGNLYVECQLDQQISATTHPFIAVLPDESNGPFKIVTVARYYLDNFGKRQFNQSFMLAITPGQKFSDIQKVLKLPEVEAHFFREIQKESTKFSADQVAFDVIPPDGRIRIEYRSGRSSPNVRARSVLPRRD
jgi:hypothetical protein